MSQRSRRSRAVLAGAVLASLAGYGSAAGQGDGKIPITTSSAEAKQQCIKGRTLAENLRGHDSRQFLGQAAAYNLLGYAERQVGEFDESIAMYQKALATDPNFAPSG